MLQARLIDIGGPEAAPHTVVELTDEAGDRGLAAFVGPRAALDIGSPAVHNALLDLRCRKLGLPQHVMLGGAVRTAVPLVAAVAVDPAAPEAAMHHADRLLGQSHARVLSLHVSAGAARLLEVVDLFARRCGGDVALRVCLHGTPNDASAQSLRRFTLECCYAERALALGVTPVGLIVNSARTEPLRELAPRAAINAVLTDARTAAGPAALDAIGAVAQVFQLEVALAAPTGSPLDLLANAHAAASGFAMHGGVEISCVPDFSLFGASAADFLHEGAIVLSDAPGLGLQLDETALRRRGLSVERMTLR